MHIYKYVAALTNYGENYNSMQSLVVDQENDALEDVNTYIHTHSDDEDEAVRAQGGASFMLEQNVPLLRNMNRISCSSHLLDQIGKIDSNNAAFDPVYKEKYDCTFEKLNKIWSQKDSRISAEIFKLITGRNLVVPHGIRWLQRLTMRYVFFALCLSLIKTNVD